MKILALDLASTTGFALSANGVITHGAQKFGDPKLKDSPAFPEGARFVRFQRWLRDRIATDKPDAIVYEEPMGNFKSAHARNVVVGLRGILLMTAAYYEIPTTGVAQTKLKKFATGKGNAKKADMIAAAARHWPDEVFADDNAADAFLLLHLHMGASLQPAL
jgi:Holliday junction resolvasome RuvABC endonuclease subunit